MLIRPFFIRIASHFFLSPSSGVVVLHRAASAIVCGPRKMRLSVRLQTSLFQNISGSNRTGWFSITCPSGTYLSEPLTSATSSSVLAPLADLKAADLSIVFHLGASESRKMVGNVHKRQIVGSSPHPSILFLPDGSCESKQTNKPVSTI